MLIFLLKIRRLLSGRVIGTVLGYLGKEGGKCKES